MNGSNDTKDNDEYEAYVGFYTKNKISPVHQDISDLGQHYSRRDYLYRNMGVLPYSLEGKTVLEFAPGSGHNALYTSSLKPERYLLVDINPTGLEESEALLKEHFPNATCHEFVLSRIQHFESDEKFDVVLCEGAIPHQADPAAFARHVGSFVKPGGVMVITTSDYVGQLSEVLRRLIGETVLKPNMSVTEKLDVLRPVFEPHLETIKGMSRPVDHWILDNIINEWRNPMFAIDEAIRTLDRDFEVYGTSPRFITDYRWYKTVSAEEACINQTAIDQYDRHGLSFIDGRCVLPAVEKEVADTVRALCANIWTLMVEIQVHKKEHWQDVSDLCTRIADVLRPYSGETAAAIDEVADYFSQPGRLDPKTHFDKFLSFFGHGQQYISFVRKRDFIDGK